MEILLTGGCGYIGSHMAVEFARSGYRVVVVDDFSNSKPDILDKLSKLIPKKNWTFYEVDVKSSNSLAKVFSAHKLSCVVHLAGPKSVPESQQEPGKYYLNNVFGSANVLDEMARHGVRFMIFSSSASVYGPEVSCPFREDDVLSPSNPYSRSKLIVENMIKDYVNAGLIRCGINLRYFNPVGRHNSQILKEDPLSAPSNLMPIVCEVASGKRPLVEVYGSDYETPDGTGVRDYIHIEDLVGGHIAAVKKILEMTSDGVLDINLGTGKGTSVLDLINTFSQVHGIEIPYRFSPRRAGDIPSAFANVELAKEILSWTATKDLKDMCLDSWDKELKV